MPKHSKEPDLQTIFLAFVALAALLVTAGVVLV